MVESAFSIVARDGYEALTMRSLAAALQTGPASFYAHVVNKADLDELLVGHLCNQIKIPTPDKANWPEQIVDVCTQLRDQYLRYPGISRAQLAVAPANVNILRISEGMLYIMIEGGVEPQKAAWTIDALILYVNAYCLEQSVLERRPGHSDGTWVVSREELLRRFANLPDTFPQTKLYAMQLTSGEGHERFEFTLRLILKSL
jgi:AcrR family transcriptional regulator